MPKRQSTAAQMARLRQAGTGEKYTEALRAVQSARADRFVMFSARGAGWKPITERAVRRLAQIWPAGPAPHWEEKFGELCWKSFPWMSAPAEAAAVVRKAFAEAAITCQTCPAPGRKRVVWIWDSEYGWITPWVKNCCDGCYWVPRNLTNDGTYRFLVEEYEEPEPEPEMGGCCVAIEDVALAVRAEFDQGGVPALLAKLEELRESMWSRSPHYDVYSGHAVVLAVDRACGPLLYRMRQAGIVSELLLPEAERRQVVRAINDLEGALSRMAAEEQRD
ncbi:hypothetical protein ACFU5O_36445 [Streptomyces sp. NPDC057445]|uniref:hypothetical protein n=1 Tax=Streptomyces sp. NPDC057445 TaxID=3346136 RepID=UPI003694A0CC